MKRIFFAVIACALGCMSAIAQNDRFETPSTFISVRGGAQTIFLTKNGGDKKFTPAVGLAIGEKFNPYLGARLDFEGVWNKVDLSGSELDYKSVTADIDLMLNVTNCFRQDKSAPLNFYLLGGAGVNCDSKYILNDWYNFRAGAIAEYRLSRITSLNIEVDGNYMGGSKPELYGGSKWKVAAFLGLSFNLFPSSSVKSRQRVPESVDAPITSKYESGAERTAAGEADAKMATANKANEADANRKAAEAKKAQEAKEAQEAVTEKKAQVTAAKHEVTEESAAKQEPVEETLFFTIGSTDKADMWNKVVDAAAAWCKKHSDKSITVSGYADKDTGTAEVNARIADARAQKVANAIKAKGVPAKQVKVKSYGDKVQPFAENDKNRCVIIEGK